MAAAFDDVGLAAEIKLLRGAEIADATEALQAHDLVVVGGGDGTLGAAARVLLDRPGSALGILPLGTHNHFARQLNIPQDLAGAASVLAQGVRRQVDVGGVDGRIFLNNASIGFYPSLVRSRDQEQQRHAIPKWLANIPATWAALRRLRHHRLRVEIDGDPQTVVTPLLFVGNNRYALDGGRIGERAALDEGELSIFAVESRTRLGALGFALRLIAGLADLDRDFALARAGRTLTVQAHAGEISVALDGEVHRLKSPLDFHIQPRALEVIAPRDQKADYQE